MRSQHSRIGPSRAALIWHCQGSVQAEDAVGRPAAGEAAARGTKLHAIAETLLRTGVDLPDDTPEEVALYIGEVRRLAAVAGVAPLIEHRLDLSTYHPEMFGTLDAAVVDLEHAVLTVADLKSGLHQVSTNALQLRLYGAMTYVTLPLAEAQRIKRVDTILVQLDGDREPVRRARHRVADILNALSAYIERVYVATDEENPPRTAGPWCRDHFCAARTVCPAFRAMTLREAQAEFTPVAIGE